jgi:hypothetical protein
MDWELNARLKERGFEESQLVCSGYQESWIGKENSRSMDSQFKGAHGLGSDP